MKKIKLTEFNTKSNLILTIDLKQWKMSRNLTCKIISETENDFIIENNSGEQINFSKSLISSNNMTIGNNTLIFSKSQYQRHFLCLREQQNKLMNAQFEENKNIIFQNRDLILTNAPYYLIRPNFLTSGASHVGGFNYCLGSLFDSFNRESPFFYKELVGYKNMYLVKLSGSVLNGVYLATFWSDVEGEFIVLTSDKDGPLPLSLYTTLKSFQRLVSFSLTEIDYQDKAIENLLIEIKNTKV